MPNKKIVHLKKFQISYRRSRKEIYAIDLTVRQNGVSRKLVSMKFPATFDYAIMGVIKAMLEEGVLEIHGTTTDPDKA